MWSWARRLTEFRDGDYRLESGRHGHIEDSVQFTIDIFLFLMFIS